MIAPNVEAKYNKSMRRIHLDGIFVSGCANQKVIATSVECNDQRISLALFIAGWLYELAEPIFTVAVDSRNAFYGTEFDVPEFGIEIGEFPRGSSALVDYYNLGWRDIALACASNPALGRIHRVLLQHLGRVEEIA